MRIKFISRVSGDIRCNVLEMLSEFPHKVAVSVRSYFADATQCQVDSKNEQSLRP